MTMQPIPAFLAFLSLLIVPPAFAEFPTNSAANRVLFTDGEFDSRSGSLQNAETTDGPVGIAIDPATGKLFVSSQFEHRILRFADVASLASGTAAEAVIGQTGLTGQTDPGTGSGRLDGPQGLAIDADGNLWVADSGNNRVLRFPNAANVGSGSAVADLVLGQDDFDANADGTGADEMYNPVGVFVDASDNLWVADYRNNRVLKFPNASNLTDGDPASVVIGWPDFSTPELGTAIDRFFRPRAVFVDAGDRLWVADERNSRVLRFDGAGAIGNGASAVQVLGQPNFDGDFAPNPPTASSMFYPSALFVDANGDLYVSDNTNDRLLIFHNAVSKTVTKSADRVLGAPNFTTTNPGATATARTLARPHGIAMDDDGNLWIVDGNRVLRYAPVQAPSPDRTKPTLRVTKRPPKTTNKAKVPVAGQARDAGGIRAVRYRVGRGAFRNASGTTSWRFSAKLAKKKSNAIQIYAEDRSGNRSGTTTVRARRR